MENKDSVTYAINVEDPKAEPIRFSDKDADDQEKLSDLIDEGYLTVSVFFLDNGVIKLVADMWYEPDGEYTMTVNNFSVEVAMKMFAAGARVANKNY